MNISPLALPIRPRSLRVFFVLFALFASRPLPTQAENSDLSSDAEVVPAGILLKPAPDYAQWTVTWRYPKEKNPPSGDETCLMEVKKTGNVVYEKVVDGRGCHEETWHMGAIQYRKPAGQSAWFMSEPANSGTPVNSDYSPMPANGYRGWDWMERDSFVGKLECEFGTCFAFVPGGMEKLKLPGSGLNEENLATQPLVAYVDAETRLPAALRSGGVTQKFEFASPPTAKLELPSELANQIKQAEAARQRLYQPPPRPY